MTISTPTFEASYEFISALNAQVALFLDQAKINFRQANTWTTESNPITAFAPANVVFGVTPAGGTERIFTIALSITETPAGTVNSDVVAD